jgi:hypothetical protein
VSFGVARAQAAVPIKTALTVCGAHSTAAFCAPRLRGTVTLRL